jgi:uncharacterized protein YoxC
MSEIDGINSDTLELIERRLTEKIEAEVRNRLFKAYLTLGSAVIAVLGFFGWNVVSELKDIMSDRFQQQIIEPYDTLSREINGKLALADAVQDGTNRSLLRIENAIAAVQPNIGALASFSDQIKDLDTKTKDLQGMLAGIQSSTAAVADISRRVPDLADQLQKLAASINRSQPTAAVKEIASQSGSIRDSVTEAAKTIDAPSGSNTVFLQYSEMPQETAERIQKELAGYGFLVPGVDLEAMPQSGLSQARYYYDADQPAAAALAERATAIVQNLGLSAPPIEVTSYTNWPRRKPQPGTLELWIGLPASGSQSQLQSGFKESAGERQIEKIIISDTQQENYEAEIAGLVTNNVSYHYLIKSGGELVKLVDENNVAFHSAGQNADSIGIGLMHISGTEYTDEQIKALAELLRDIVGRRSLPATSILARSDVNQSKLSDFPTIKDSVLALVYPPGGNAP